jgi:copper(I)-binding protein
MNKKIYPLALFLIFLIATLSGCGSNNLEVKDAWARPGNNGAMSAVYFSVVNSSDQDDVLLSADSDVAEHVELHMSMMSDEGTMSMQPQENVPIPNGSEVAFEPGGLHVMLINLESDLRPGDGFSLSLNFQQAGTVEIEVPVREP